MSTVTEILDQALQLDPPDRGLIAHRLIVSLKAEAAEDDQNEIDTAWEAEILRRSEDLRSDRVRGIDGRDSVDRIRTALDARKKP